MEFAIVGFGQAGYHAARSIRSRDPEAGIHIYSDTCYPPYNPMLTTYYVAGKLPRNGMFPYGELEGISSALRLETHMGQKVARVKAREKKLVLSDGTERRFDGILIATGARAFCPPVSALGDESLFVMRTVEDADRFRARLEERPPSRALIVGASMTGIKLVELLTARGVKCTLADMAPHIFPLAALPETAGRIQERIAARGVELRFGQGLSDVVRDGEVLRAALSGGEELAVDMVLLCIGTRAATSLVDPAEVTVNKGIVVDERMRTSAPGIYAAGDCCEGNDLQSGQTRIIGLWENAGRQGDCAGRNMAGEAAEHYGEIVHNITHFMDMDFISFGDNRLPGERECFEIPRQGIWAEVVHAGGAVRCINLLDTYRTCGTIKSVIKKRLADPDLGLNDWEKGLLESQGFPQKLIDLLGGKKDGR